MIDFAKLYGRYSDDELVRLYADVSSLTEDAKTAFAAEIKKRGLTSTDLANLAQEQTEFTASVDRAWQQERREKAHVLGRRIAIRFAIAVVGMLLALGYELLTTNPPSQLSTTSRH